MNSARSKKRNGQGVRRSHGLRFALMGVVLGLGVAETLAQCTEQQKLTASDAAAGDLFGGSVFVSGETALVGSRRDNCASGQLRCGAAYVMHFNGTSWDEVQKLTPSDAASRVEFGSSVSVDGTTAVVGAPRDDCASGDDCGSAYVFRFNGTTWVEEQRLTASDGAASDFFGLSVAVSGDTVLMGAFRDDCDAGDDCGSAYVFRFNGTTWVQEQKLIAADRASGDLFGLSVSLSGEMIFVGAVGDHVAGLSSGSAHVFRFNGISWVNTQRLIPSDAANAQGFGGHVSISGETAMVGAEGDACHAGFKCGAVYVFGFNGTSWVEQQKLVAPDPVASARFGPVSVSGGTAVVGARGAERPTESHSGVVYVFRFNGTSWFQEQKLTASDAAMSDHFGNSVSVSGETILVGAASNGCATGLDSCGAAYVFSCPPPRSVHLDVQPRSCPNLLNQKSKGLLPVAVVGTPDFDVATIDLDSLTLTRADGAGSSVSPLLSRRGSRTVIEDVATPIDGESCACHELGGDGIDDLVLRFSTPEVNAAFGLNASDCGQATRLVLRGSLQDGSTFEGIDCVVVRATRPVVDEPGLVAVLPSPGVEVPFVERVLSTNTLPTQSVFAIDMDGDGDIDVLASSGGDLEGRIAWYENDGDSPPTFPERVIANGLVEVTTVFATDVDGDGDIDVISAPRHHGKLTWYENDGSSPPTFTERSVSTEARGSSSVVAADVDGDGDTDVLTASSSTIAWYENDGGSPPNFIERVISHVGDTAQGVVATDLDGDGDIDVLTAVPMGHKIAWFENDGGLPPTFAEHEIFAGVCCGATVLAKDLDGDRDVDLLFASRGFLHSQIVWHENTGGSPPMFTERVIPTSRIGQASVFAMDIDGDGDMDVLLALSSENKIVWYQNDGDSPPSFTSRVISTSRFGAQLVLAADMDRDGDTDVLSASRVHDNIVWYENTTPPCGDGVVDPGQACDDGGESATCDANCTVAVCGDDTLNVTAGEECDGGFDCTDCHCDVGFVPTTPPSRVCRVAPTPVSLDIKPDACPNTVNPRSSGTVSVAIVGSLGFDVATVDACSLVLLRADGVGDSVLPILGRRGPRTTIEDVATALDGETCACHESGRDGFDDLSVKFSTAEVTSAFELNELSRGETIEVLLQGTLQDGTPFEGVDCIVVPGTQRTSSGLRRSRRSK